MDLSVLKEIKAELRRFEKRLDDAMKRIAADGKEGYNWGGGTKENGAVRRAALDLKNELTKIT